MIGGRYRRTEYPRRKKTDEAGQRHRRLPGGDCVTFIVNHDLVPVIFQRVVSLLFLFLFLVVCHVVAPVATKIFTLSHLFYFVQVYTVNHHVEGATDARLDLTLNYDVSLPACPLFMAAVGAK